MKRLVSIIIIAGMVLSALAFASCDGKSSEGDAPAADSKYVGVWNATKAVIDDEETAMEEILGGGVYILDLKEDGTAVVTEEKEATGTWTEKSDGIHVKAGDTDTDFKADGDNLVMEILGAKVVFEKQ